MARAQVRDFLADRKELTIGEDDDPIKVVYRPARINSEFHRTLRDFQDDPDGDGKVLVFSICTLISDWNLTGPLTVDEPVIDRKGRPVKDDYGVIQYETREIVADGQKIPLKSEYVKHLPIALLGAVFTAITDDMKPDPKSETTS